MENDDRFENLRAFVQELRRFHKSKTVGLGVNLLWKTYRDVAWRKAHPDKSQILNSYAPRIIILALAASNNWRSNYLNEVSFYNMCHDYLSIVNPIEDAEFRADEETKIRTLLIEGGVIPERFLTTDNIRHCGIDLSISRMIGAQHETFMTDLNELLRAYRIFEIWDNKRSGEITEISRRIFNIDPIHFFRSGFMLFALANSEKRNGFVSFDELLTEEDVIVDVFEISIETCRLVASKISYDHGQLWPWYQSVLDNYNDYYQQFVPLPLRDHPAICLDVLENGKQYVLPSPAHFVRGFINSFFSRVLNNGEGALFGEAIEDCIFESLQHIFGADNVLRIGASNRHADFLIRHECCDLVLEVKAALGSYQDQSTMGPEAIERLWGRLYGALEQCAYSMREHKNNEHPILGIIIIAEHATMESSPFLNFAERAGIFQEMSILGVDCLSWNRIEYVLSKSSVEDFLTTLKAKWVNENRRVGDHINFNMSGDSPSHNFEYLNAAHTSLFPTERFRNLDR